MIIHIYIYMIFTYRYHQTSTAYVCGHPSLSRYGLNRCCDGSPLLWAIPIAMVLVCGNSNTTWKILKGSSDDPSAASQQELGWNCLSLSTSGHIGVINVDIYNEYTVHPIDPMGSYYMKSTNQLIFPDPPVTSVILFPACQCNQSQVVLQHRWC